MARLRAVQSWDLREPPSPRCARAPLTRAIPRNRPGSRADPTVDTLTLEALAALGPRIVTNDCDVLEL